MSMISAKVQLSVAVLLGTMVLGLPARADNPRYESEAGVGRLRVVGLTADSQLVLFWTGSPASTRKLGFVTGLNNPDTSLVGIDYRVQDGSSMASVTEAESIRLT